MRPRFILILALILAFASCGDDDASVDDAGGETQVTEATTAPEPTGEAPTDDDSDDGSSDEAPPPDETPPTDTGLPPLPADPQRIEFEASDGKMLVGHYLPAAMNPAPIVVFGHWAGGDQRDWIEIGPWLQNRLDELPAGWQDAIGPDCGPQREGPWLDPTWFPMNNGSYGVFFFDYRDFCESEMGLGDPPSGPSMHRPPWTRPLCSREWIRAGWLPWDPASVAMGPLTDVCSTISAARRAWGHSPCHPATTSSGPTTS